MMTKTSYALWISMLFGLAACVAATGPQRGAPVSFGQAISVLDIIDGDTIRIQDRATGAITNARLVGFDTPETFEPGCDAELELGQQATQRLQVILARARDIATSPQGMDRYDRLLLKLSVDGRDLADIMVAEGLAVRYSGGQRINWCKKLAAS